MECGNTFHARYSNFRWAQNFVQPREIAIRNNYGVNLWFYGGIVSARNSKNLCSLNIMGIFQLKCVVNMLLQTMQHYKIAFSWGGGEVYDCDAVHASFAARAYSKMKHEAYAETDLAKCFQ